jgi:DNA-binding NarL/FixJ family response regulator
MKSLRILLADDHDIVRWGVQRILEQQAGWQICGEAGDGREAIRLTEQLHPDIVIIDIGMPELNGFEATRQIKRRVPETEVLVFSAAEDRHSVHAAFESGARGYLMKSDIARHLVHAVESLAQHRPFFTPKVSEIVFERYLESGDPSAIAVTSSSALTEREREVVQLLAEGNSNKEVAAKLGISSKTAETHRAAVMRKLGMKSFSELVRYAIRQRIIEP